VFFFGIFFFQAEKKPQRKKNHKKEKICKEGRELTFKLLLCPLTFGSCFCLFVFAFLFQVLSPGIFFFLSKRKEKEKKKTHREKKNAEKGRSLPSSSCSTLSFFAFASAHLLLPFLLSLLHLG
jgi:preprotein translocase subunit YajC